MFQPGTAALEYGDLTPETPIVKALGDMEHMRAVLKDLRRAELVAAANPIGYEPALGRNAFHHWSLAAPEPRSTPQRSRASSQEGNATRT
jgi:hypothetical protein